MATMRRVVRLPAFATGLGSIRVIALTPSLTASDKRDVTYAQYVAEEVAKDGLPAPAAGVTGQTWPTMAALWDS
jgi:hypothetical protein